MMSTDSLPSTSWQIHVVDDDEAFRRSLVFLLESMGWDVVAHTSATRFLEQGLPQQNAYVTILRDGLDSDGLSPCGLYFGTSSGHLFASRDGGEHWQLVSGFLPGILSVTAAVGPA